MRDKTRRDKTGSDKTGSDKTGSDKTRTDKTWGLIYKTVRRIDVKRWRTHETQKVLTQKNILIYKTVCTHVLRRFSFINHNPL